MTPRGFCGCLLLFGLTTVFGGRLPSTPDSTSPTPTAAGQYYVSPNASGSGNGSIASPWSLAQALDGAAGRIHPGDTVWLRGGTYRGTFRTTLEGSKDQWIVFRQSRGERAVIDGTLRADGAYLAFWGFEIMQSTPSTYGLQANTNYGKFINLVVHDAGSQGISFWTPGVDAELYGCIVYNNGTKEDLDHGTYVHNEDGTKLVADNVFFDNLAMGIHVYASHNNPGLRNVRVEGNVAFNNGTISNVAPARENIIVNAQVPTQGIVVVGNMMYYSDTDGINLRVGHHAAEDNKDIEIRDNYAAGGALGIEMAQQWHRATVTGNVVVGGREVVLVAGSGLADNYHWTANTWVQGPGTLAWESNKHPLDWDDWRRATGLGGSDTVRADAPHDAKVFIRPNRYEPGRANIVIYNWARQPAVAVDVSQVLHAGDQFEVHSVQALTAAPVVSGVYQGGSINIPMSGVAPPPPIGRGLRTPPRTGPAFDVFLLTSSSH